MADETLQALAQEHRRRSEKSPKIAISIRLEEDLYVPMLEKLTSKLNATQTELFKAGLVLLADKVATGRYKSLREVLNAKE